MKVFSASKFEVASVGGLSIVAGRGAESVRTSTQLAYKGRESRPTSPNSVQAADDRFLTTRYSSNNFSSYNLLSPALRR